MPPPMQHREEREPQDRRHQSRKARRTRRSVAASAKQPADMCENIKRPFRCDTCGKGFKQTQGRNRHYREKHDPDLCVLCDVEWGRPYQYRDHLETHHPGVDPDMIIGKTDGSRRRVASFARRAPQQKVLPSAIEHYGRGHSDIGSYPPILPPPAVEKPPTVTATRIMPSKISSEGTTNIGLLYVTYAHTPFPSIEENTQATWTALLGAGEADWSGSSVSLLGGGRPSVGPPGWMC